MNRAIFFASMLTSCVSQRDLPAALPHDARGGIAPAHFDASRACGDWKHAVAEDPYALVHVSFAEMDRDNSCFTAVRYDGETARADAPVAGCGYRAENARAVIEAEADRYERIAQGESITPPLELACDLSDHVRRASAKNNAHTLRAVLADTPQAPFAYASIEAFGYGHPAHAGTALDTWTPGDACPSGIDLRRFGMNVDRAARAALAWEGHVAPFVVMTGGAVHSRLVEAFLLDYIATCRIGVPRDRVLVDPCANHTHTNIRNAGRVLRAIGGRASYIVTDDFLQSAYLQDWNALHLVGGSLDQRSLRDWGYLLGSWRQASVGIGAGFWYTPFRFWADHEQRDFSCVR